jgi:signal transduction histidine kinase
MTGAGSAAEAALDITHACEPQFGVVNSSDPLTRLEALLEEQAALRRVATLVARDADSARLFDVVCEELGRVLDVQSTDMVRFEGDGTATVVGTWSGSGAPSFPVGTSISVEGDTVTGKLHRSARPERVDDYDGVPGELAERLRSFGVRSVVGAPITVAGRLWGAIMVVSDEPRSFAADTEERMAGFAELVTAALANVDAREQLAASRARIVEAGYEERRRLGRDLHDGAQQELVAAVISLKLARRKWAQAPEEALELVEQALERTESGIRDLRDLAAGIHPSVLSDRGLRAALEGLASRSPVPVELAEVPERRLPPPIETSAYFVVAEALTNAAKHARCTHVNVRVGLDDGSATVEVRDDGVGGANVAAGTGLRGLADRVNALGGELEIDSPEGAGTTVRARIAAPDAEALQVAAPQHARQA